MTLAVMGLCVLAWLLQRVPGSGITSMLGFAPSVALAEPWRFLTAAFLHSPSGIFHILFNLYALWLTGPYLEDLLGRLPALDDLVDDAVLLCLRGGHDRVTHVRARA